MSDTPHTGDERRTSYPRPQFVREAWVSLDGTWQFAFSNAKRASEVRWNREITVPYPPESALSGIADEGFHPVVWYRRSFEVPPDWRGKRVLLHFGAVDYAARVWVNGHLVASHEGGHTPFSADITEALREGEQVVVVRAEDDPKDLHKPRGKQDWLLEPHSIWYPRTTGIWQSVWLEPVPERCIEKVRFTPDLARFAIRTEVSLTGGVEGLRLDVTFRLGEEVLIEDSWRLQASRVARELVLPDPGIDDARRTYLWSPEHPALIDVELTLREGDEVLERVRSYTALRSLQASHGRFYLNGRPYFLRLVLDQGYWQDGLMTAPSPEALRRDIELTKAMGFNGVRKHQKLEDPRYLYWADRLGLLVWEELPSAYSFSPEAVERLTREWLEAIDRDYNHPCIVAWVPFNESWGVPDLPEVAPQRHAVAALYHLAKALDPTRPVVGNDGWEHVAADMLTIHDYTSDAEVLRARYESAEAVRETTRAFRPGGRDILLADMRFEDQPVVLSEFGGIRFSHEAKGWGYSQVQSPEALLACYRNLISAASGDGLAGFCYTQLTDTFQEQNGLLSMDRRPKVPLDALAAATRGEVDG